MKEFLLAASLAFSQHPVIEQPDLSEETAANTSAFTLIDKKPRPMPEDPITVYSSASNALETKVDNSKVAPSIERASTTRPNIVMFMLDDVNPMDGRFFTQERTPNIYNTFVKKGINFTNVHTETTLCCPGRQGYLTGQHTQNHGVKDLDGTVAKQGTTIATELDKQGYHTIFTGKYLNFYAEFPRWKRTPPGWDRFDAIFENQGRYYNYRWRSKNGEIKYYGSLAKDYSTDVIADETVRRLRNAPKNSPVLLWVNPYTMHEPLLPAPRHKDSLKCSNIKPWNPPNSNEEDVSDKPPYIQSIKRSLKEGFNLKRRCEMLLSVDQMVGRIVGEMKRQGRYNDTIFILAADNGMGFSENRITKKTVPHATRVPFYMTWVNGRGDTPRNESTILSNIDVAPTLCEIAGCVMGPYPNGQERADGVSFASLMKDNPYAKNRDAILISQPVKPEGTSPSNRPKWWGVVTTDQNDLGRWLYAEYKSEKGETIFKELYDMSGGACHNWTPDKGGDPCRLNNLLAPGSNPTEGILDIKNALSKKIVELRKEKGFQAP